MKKHLQTAAMPNSVFSDINKKYLKKWVQLLTQNVTVKRLFVCKRISIELKWRQKKIKLKRYHKKITLKRKEVIRNEPDVCTPNLASSQGIFKHPSLWWLFWTPFVNFFHSFLLNVLWVILSAELAVWLKKQTKNPH